MSLATEPDPLAVADSYLASRGCTLWGRAFDVQDPKTRPDAAAWFLIEMMQFANHLAAARSASGVDANQPSLFEVAT
jgi:hypothetical protein